MSSERMHLMSQGIVQLFENKRGSYGVIVRNRLGETVFDYNSSDWFPLASAGKVALATLVAWAVADKDLSWSLELDSVALDPEEDSATLYPHLQGMQKLPLRNVVEIMIACHDKNCADAVANLLGGWTHVESLVTRRFPGVRVNRDPRNQEENIGQLRSVLDVIQGVISGFLATPNVFEPVVAGLVRMVDKTDGIPFHEQWNMTGGLPTSLINTGVLGDPMSERYLLYAIAGRDVANRYETRESDELISSVLNMLYGTFGISHPT